jgi:hypothetical protein
MQVPHVPVLRNFKRTSHNLELFMKVGSHLHLVSSSLTNFFYIPITYFWIITIIIIIIIIIISTLPTELILPKWYNLLYGVLCLCIFFLYIANCLLLTDS